jgi:cyclic pyranopterin phosphate synthase
MSTNGQSLKATTHDCEAGTAATATDSHGRRINYLRLSVTDNCNLRCRYCMPHDARKLSCGTPPLSYDELLRLARCATEIGIGKIRITGGEPLVRSGLVGFLESLSALPLLDELVLTTNGMLLEKMAPGLRTAGVNRLNVSLDSLNPERFREITRGGSLSKVMAGLKAAEKAGFPAPKINVVMMRGVNDHEALAFAALTMDSSLIVRFIEYMPTVGEQDWRRSFISGGEILDRIRAHYPLEEIEKSGPVGPARNFRISGAKGALGVVTAVSDHFCGSCNRIRVTAAGFAKGCLFGMGATDLKPYVAAGNEVALRTVLRQIISEKPMGHSLHHPLPETDRVAMYQVGG